jgi:two-component system CheB/CheR fusion protein
MSMADERAPAEGIGDAAPVVEENGEAGEDSSDTCHGTVVGIGASAGALAALRNLFATVPEHNGLAWVVVVHLSPEHESHLAALLQPHVAMAVQQVTESIRLEPDRVYVIPPNANLEAIDTHLRLSRLEPQRRERAPIDHFLRTLSRTHDGHAVAVILSGTGRDGAIGLREIKEKGGLTIVQDPDEAEYDGMPRAAIGTGMVDMILPIERIPDAIIGFSRTEPRIPMPSDGEEPDEAGQRILHKVLAQVRTRTGRDFSRYKRSTFLRRIARRMQMREVEDLSAYVDILREDSNEVRDLADDMLITVTRFFRDPEVFEAIEKTVIPRIFDARGAGDEVRVWSVGCSTGEEAYSIAMLLAEEAARREEAPLIQVFATDLHEPSLVRARAAVYQGEIEADVSPDRLMRFFLKQNGGYQVRKEIRDMVVFAPHNLLGDPPFSRLDLVICRNVLIYLQRSVQPDVFALLHYALRPQGFLILGTSETIDTGDLFRVEHKRHGVYRKLNVPGPEPRLPVFPLSRPHSARRQGAASIDRTIAYGELHERMVERFGPPSLLLNPDDGVVHVSEHAGRYLVHPGGEITTNVFKLVREELRIPLRTALHDVRRTTRRCRTNPIPVRFNGDTRFVRVDVRPTQSKEQDGYILILFDEYDALDEGMYGEARDTTRDAADSERISQIETRFEHAQQRLQAVIQEYETSQEEIKASNEELQSSNEELRSTLEELETSKEELHSMNEELQTVNQENRHKVTELAQLTSDLQNLMAATDIATLFLDRQLRILRFTPKVGDLFSVRASDQGRPLTDITHRLGRNAILQDAEQVLASLVPIEREIRDDTGRWYLTRVLPYRSPDDHIGGIVITFIETTGYKEAVDALRRSQGRFRAAIDNLLEPFMICTAIRNAEGTIVDFAFDYANEAARVSAGQPPAGDLDRTLLQTYPQVADSPLFGWWTEATEKGTTIVRQSFPFNLSRVGGEGVRYVDFQITGYAQGCMSAWRDVTERTLHEEALRTAKDAAVEANSTRTRFLSTLSQELRTPLNAVIGLADLMASEVVGQLNDTQKDYMARIRASAWYQLSMIEDILNFTRAEEGRFALREDRVDIAAVAREVADMFDPTVQKKGIEFAFTTNSDSVVSLTDGGKLRQILTNLVGNAIKFTETGGVYARFDMADGDLIFEVRDTGAGIPQESVEDIFKPFFQVDNSHTREEAGTGLGLAVSLRLAELLGGRLSVESEVGSGSTFTLRIPRREPPTADRRPAPSPG